jgi:hypothetical protein
MTPGFMRGLPGEGSLLSQQFDPGTRWARREDEAGRTSTTDSLCLTSPLGDGMRMIERRGDGGLEATFVVPHGLGKAQSKRTNHVIIC